MAPALAESSAVRLPADANTDIPVIALNWLSQYDILREEVTEYHMMWSNVLHGLIFPFYAIDYALNAKKLVAWQARLFSRGGEARQKYMTVGPKEEVFFCVSLDKARKHGIILVEDVISAIKVGRHACTMPLLGSHVSLNRQIQLRKYTDKLTFWLDYDKSVDANKFATACAIIGYKTNVIMTPDDPKELSDQEIKEMLVEVDY